MTGFIFSTTLISKLWCLLVSALILSLNFLTALSFILIEFEDIKNPRNSNPCLNEVSLVFSGWSSRSRSSSIHRLVRISASSAASRVLARTTKSSAYRTNLHPFSSSVQSRWLSTMFEINGEMTPPYAKKVIMQSKPLKPIKYGLFQSFTLHNI